MKSSYFYSRDIALAQWWFRRDCHISATMLFAFTNECEHSIKSIRRCSKHYRQLPLRHSYLQLERDLGKMLFEMNNSPPVTLLWYW